MTASAQHIVPRALIDLMFQHRFRLHCNAATDGALTWELHGADGWRYGVASTQKALAADVAHLEPAK